MRHTATTSYENGKLTLTLDCECGAAATSPSPAPAPGPQPTPQPGPAPTFTVAADLPGVTFIANAPWYADVDQLPVHPRSREIILATTPVVASLGRRTQNDWGPDFGMPYAVGTGFPAVPVVAAVPDETDAGPYHVPLDAPIEPGDKHLLFLDRQVGKLYELFDTVREGTGFKVGSAAVWDLSKPADQRPLGWTSADAAGLPILPLLVRYDEFKAALAAGTGLPHALRFTLKDTGKGFIPPARHYASLTAYSLPGRPPMGMRIRVSKDLDLSQFNDPTQVLLRTLQIKGGILADNGSNFFVSGVADPRWAEYFDAITGTVNGKRGFKSFAGAEFDAHIEVIEFKDSDVVTQVD